eukprot:5631877-Ditylum_brightwellii.AAC.1
MLNVGAKFDITLVALKDWSKGVRDDLNRRMVTEVKSLADVGKGWATGSDAGQVDDNGESYDRDA